MLNTNLGVFGPNTDFVTSGGGRAAELLTKKMGRGESRVTSLTLKSVTEIVALMRPAGAGERSPAAACGGVRTPLHRFKHWLIGSSGWGRPERTIADTCGPGRAPSPGRRH